MRKIISFIYIFAVIAVLGSCSKELTFEGNTGGDSITEGKVLVNFSIKDMSPHAVTKTLDEPEIETIKLVVYDQNGVYVEQIDATLNPDDDDSGKWQANLSLSDSERHIHFLANYPTTVPFGTEVEIISQLSTDDDAYWQRVVLPKISATLVGAAGEEHLELDQKAALQDIVLVRNYAKVSLTAKLDEESDSFTIESAAVYNVPDHGTIAPYSPVKSKFIDNYQSVETPEALQATPYFYQTNIPKTFSLTEPEETEFVEPVSGCVTMYMFEKEIPLDNAAFVIVKGKYKGSSNSSYYRINLKGDDGNFYPIFRNFEYKINIKKVSAGGYSSLEEAIASPGSGDISTDTRYGSLTNISNGEARIFVSHTEMTLVNSNPVQVKFNFIPDVTKPDEVDNTKVNVSLGSASSLGAVFSGMSKVVYDSSVTDSDGITTITLTPSEPNAYVRKQSLILTGTYTVGEETATITREIVFILREKPEIRLSAPISIAKTAGTKLDLGISIPGGLSESMFPLNMLIEAAQGTLTPDMSGSKEVEKNLPVRYGPSFFNSSHPGFYFVRQITWNEYIGTAISDGLKTFHARFKSNAAASASAIIVRNDYFIDGSTYFKNPEDSDSFSGFWFQDDLKVGTADASRTTNFSFCMTSLTPVTVTVTGASYSGSEMTGSAGTYTYTPTSTGMQTIHGLVANTYGNGITVTLSASGYTGKSATKYRYGILKADSVHSSTWLTENFGVTSWANDKGSAYLTATLNGGTMSFMVPIAVSRSGTENNFDAPNGSAERRNGNGPNKRNYRYTINPYSDDYNYYYIESDPGTDLTKGTLITGFDGDHRFTIGNNNQPNSKTIYIRAERKTDGKTSSGWSTFAYNGSSSVTQGSQGKYYTNLKYTFTGPASDTRIYFTGALNSSTQYFNVNYNATNYGTVSVSDLE